MCEVRFGPIAGERKELDLDTPIREGAAFIVVIVSEMIAVNSGLGFRILEAREFMWSDKIIAGMFTIGLLGLAIDIGMNALNARLLRWHRGINN